MNFRLTTLNAESAETQRARRRAHIHCDFVVAILLSHSSRFSLCDLCVSALSASKEVPQ